MEFRRLTEACETTTFICGYTGIEGWFSSRAYHFHSRFYSRVTTAHYQGDPVPVGFYSLKLQREPQYEFSGKSFLQDKVFTDKEPITTLHLEWFAVASDMQGRGLGNLMLGKVLDDAYQIFNRVGINAITLTYVDHKSRGLYAGYGFQDYGGDRSKKLFISAEEIMDLYREIPG